MIGACLAGLCGIGLYFFSGKYRSLAVLSTGYSALQNAVEDASNLGPTLLVAIPLIKILTTSLTISSGGSGGVFGPSMVIGGCTGARRAFFSTGCGRLSCGNRKPTPSSAWRDSSPAALCADFDDHHGFRNDRRLQPADPDDVGLHALLHFMPAVDAI